MLLNRNPESDDKLASSPAWGVALLLGSVYRGEGRKREVRGHLDPPSQLQMKKSRPPAGKVTPLPHKGLDFCRR